MVVHFRTFGHPLMTASVESVCNICIGRCLAFDWTMALCVTTEYD